ncbi:DUF2264 domain-containing protein [Marispirochaeta sp.]|uniref:DUF2264 domain-containing protein n=1 Tax=Marispirochaeta sp. TaxID=2038653 RepID=UPI0029C7AF87|nr:DUF2264 domain-containing protein [Marispirochaeta sp.]
MTDAVVGIYSELMDQRINDELNFDHVSRLFFRYMTSYKYSLSPDMSYLKGNDSPEPVLLTLMALGAYLAGEDRSDVVDYQGEMLSLSTYMVKAIENGTNPEHAGYWGGGPRSTKRHPEFAALAAFGAWSCRSLLFRRLSNRAIQLFEQWLEAEARYSVKKKSSSSLAVALNHAARKGMGMRHDPRVIDTAFETLESCYLDQGWFADGGKGSRRFDDSVSWGYFSLLAAILHVEGGKKSPRYQKWGPRLRKDLRDFAYLYDSQGNSPRYGKESGELLAGLAGPAAGYLVGVWPGKNGVLKRLVRLAVNRMLSADEYNAGIPLRPPYRSMQTLGFLLLLAGNDDFWSIKEEPLSIERGDYVHFIPSPGWLIHGAKSCGHVQLINGGTQRDKRQRGDETVTRYGKFTYSGTMGYVLGTGNNPRVFCCDNSLSASADKKSWSHRDRIDSFKLVADRVLLTSMHLPVASVGGSAGTLKVDSLIVPLRSGAQVRIHRVRRGGLSGGAVNLREGGYALGLEVEDSVETVASGQLARAEGPRGFSLVRILGGYSFAAISQGYEGRKDGHSLSSSFLLPRVETILRSRETRFLALFIHGGTDLAALDTGDSIIFNRKGDKVSLFSGNKLFFEYDFQSA